MALAQACQVGRAALLTFLPPVPASRPRAGNILGEEGCEQLQEVLDGFSMAKVLASLR